MGYRRIVKQIRQLQAKANKYDSLVEKIKEKIEELNNQAKMQKNNTILTIIEKEKLVLQELLDTIKEK